MDWAQLFVSLLVLVGFGLLKILAELVWEGLKTRLRRELESDRPPVGSESAHAPEPPPATPDPDPDETAFAGHPRTGGGH